jgi:hypothetical protein
MTDLPKNIFLLWIQGWGNAPWLQKQVAESWKINNPEWNIVYVDIDNLKFLVNDIDYIYDTDKNISLQAKSDIIRLSLLKNHGGVWADATMLCMQPLDHWVNDAVKPSGLWMYHGNGADMPKEIGPAIWFIISKKNSYMINVWKNICDQYWNGTYQPYGYFWLDNWFKTLYYNDNNFKQLWDKTPYLYCEIDGQSHTLATYGMENNTSHIKKMFLEKPPYALKLWKHWNDVFPDITTEKCKNSNGYFAIELLKRKYIYTHEMT